MSKSLQQTWETYTASWKESDAEKRLAVFRKTLCASVVYTDPVTETRGHGPLADYMDGLRKNVPGVHFVTMSFHPHHQRSLAKWNMLDANQNLITDGVSYGEYDDDGLLVRTAVFYRLPGAS